MPKKHFKNNLCTTPPLNSWKLDVCVLLRGLELIFYSDDQRLPRGVTNCCLTLLSSVTVCLCLSGIELLFRLITSARHRTLVSNKSWHPIQRLPGAALSPKQLGERGVEWEGRVKTTQVKGKHLLSSLSFYVS